MKMLKYYNIILSVLFVSIDNIFPSKQYGRFWGISQFLVSLVILLFINFLEGVFVIITENEYPNFVSFLNIDFYLTLGILLITVQFILNFYKEEKRVESIRLANELKKSKKLNLVLVTFGVSSFYCFISCFMFTSLIVVFLHITTQVGLRMGKSNSRWSRCSEGQSRTFDKKDFQSTTKTKKLLN